MTKALPACLALLFVSLLSGCDLTPKDPRQELSDRKIPYTEQDFINNIRNGRNDIAQFFLDAGMNPNVRGEGGIPALLHAAANGRVKTMELLLGRSASVNITDKDGRTALMVAALRNDAESVKLLLKYKADPEMRLPAGGLTALQLAAAEGNIKTVEALAKGGANLDARDSDGRTALFLALDNTSVFQLLVRSGANVNVRYQGRMLYDYVKDTGNVILIKAMKAAGAQEPKAPWSSVNY